MTTKREKSIVEISETRKKNSHWRMKDSQVAQFQDTDRKIRLMWIKKKKKISKEMTVCRAGL